jgi:hypothetical protein
MTARASDLKERMRTAAIREKAPAPPASEQQPVAAAPAAQPPVQRAAPVRERRIRYTLDLSPTQHRFLKRFAFDAEVDASAVVRALLTELEDDPQLADHIRTAVTHGDE